MYKKKKLKKKPLKIQDFTLTADFALFAGKLAPNLHHCSLVFTDVEMRLQVLAIWRGVVIALDQDIFGSRLTHTHC